MCVITRSLVNSLYSNLHDLDGQPTIRRNSCLSIIRLHLHSSTGVVLHLVSEPQVVDSRARATVRKSARWLPRPTPILPCRHRLRPTSSKCFSKWSRGFRWGWRQVSDPCEPRWSSATSTSTTGSTGRGMWSRIYESTRKKEGNGEESSPYRQE